MVESLSTTVLRDDLEEIPLLIPDTEGVWFKVLKADEEAGRVIVKARFEANSRMPRHTHHCRAVAFTVSGEWEYENGSFESGDVAYESVGEEHTPTSMTGAEMLIVFDGDGGSDRWLDNHLSDGRIMRVGMRFFKALERTTLEHAATLVLDDLVDFVPAQD